MMNTEHQLASRHGREETQPAVDWHKVFQLALNAIDRHQSHIVWF
jgi:hypothetical protein